MSSDKGCPHCAGRAPNWSEVEKTRLVELMEDSLPQLTKHLVAWKPVADALNDQFVKKEGRLRCVHQVFQQFKRMEGDFRKSAKKETGGKDLPSWFSTWARMKEKEIAATIMPPAPVKAEAGATVPAPAGPGAAAAGAVPQVKTEGGTAGNRRSEAMRERSRIRALEKKDEDGLRKRAFEALVRDTGAPTQVRISVRECTGCGLILSIKGGIVIAEPAVQGCDHRGNWRVTVMFADSAAEPVPLAAQLSPTSPETTGRVTVSGAESIPLPGMSESDESSAE